ncbi:hypothetical protein [Mangrovimicrobium sediminis]|nr:hypothetical protein [Haliea sp. SAOS-164]
MKDRRNGDRRVKQRRKEPRWQEKERRRGDRRNARFTRLYS